MKILSFLNKHILIAVAIAALYIAPIVGTDQAFFFFMVATFLSLYCPTVFGKIRDMFKRILDRY